MNYYQARQRSETKRWDFTCMNDEKAWPVGYCAGFREWKDVEFYTPEQNKVRREEWEKKFLPLKDKFHCDGHETAEEAAACYRQYLLDTRLSFMPHKESAEGYYKRCAKCGTLTNGAVEVGHGEIIPICDEHQTREVMEEIYPAVGQIISSY